MMTDLLVDGNSVYARAWYAVMKRSATEPKEVLRAAIWSVLTLLNPKRLGHRVDRVLFAWDGQNKRDKGREPKSPEYYHTLELLIQYLSFLFQPAHAWSADWEADDVVATAVKMSKAQMIYVASGDKDLQQLAGTNVHYYCLNHKAVLPNRMLCDRWHVKEPNQIAIALAIIGDRNDGIAGVYGWGPKRVQKVFAEVPQEASLEEALIIVEKQIPKKFLNNFYHDLDLTLLHNDLPGIAEPQILQMAPPLAVTELKLPDFLDAYRYVYEIYEKPKTTYRARTMPKFLQRDLEREDGDGPASGTVPVSG